MICESHHIYCMSLLIQSINLTKNCLVAFEAFFALSYAMLSSIILFNLLNTNAILKVNMPCTSKILV